MALKEYYKVDLETGIILDVGLFDVEKDEIPTDYKEGWYEGFYNPVWSSDLNKWVEGTPSEEVLNQVKTAKIKELNEACEMAICEPFQASNGHLYEFQYKDQTNFNQQLSLMVLDTALTDVLWKTLDADVVIHTRDEFLQVCKDAEAHKRGNISKNWQLKGLVEASITIEEIQNMTWDA